jgi:hypothetical protein
MCQVINSCLNLKKRPWQTEASNIKAYDSCIHIKISSSLAPAKNSPDIFENPIITRIGFLPHAENKKTCCWVGWHGIWISAQKQEIFFSFQERAHKIWSPSSLLFCGYWDSFSGIKLSGRDVDHSPPFRTEVKNGWSYASKIPTYLHTMDRYNFTFTFTQGCKQFSLFIYEQCRQCKYNEHWGAFVQPLLQWKSNKYYIFWVRIWNLSYPESNTHAPYCHLCPAPLYNTFITLSHKRHDFIKMK